LEARELNQARSKPDRETCWNYQDFVANSLRPRTEQEFLSRDQDQGCHFCPWDRDRRLEDTSLVTDDRKVTADTKVDVNAMHK